MISRRKMIASIPAAGSVLLTACKDSLPPTFGSLFDALLSQSPPVVLGPGVRRDDTEGVVAQSREA